jgi:hypothetical protein
VFADLNFYKDIMTTQSNQQFSVANLYLICPEFGPLAKKVHTAAHFILQAVSRRLWLSQSLKGEVDLEQQQTEKIETEVRAVDRIRIEKVYASCPGWPSGES